MAAIGDTMTEEPRRRSRQRSSAPPRSTVDVAGDETAPAKRGRATQGPKRSDAPGNAPSPSSIPADTTPRAGVAAENESATTATAAPLVRHTAPAARRRGSPRARVRESNILGLAERARLLNEQRPTLPLPDMLLVALPDMRQALLDHSLDEGLRLVTDTLARTLAPAVAQAWIAEPPSWASEQGRVGGLELFPTLRPRAIAHAEARSQALPGGLTPAASMPAPLVSASGSLPKPPLRPDPLIEEVTEARRPVVIFDADDSPLASEWVWRMSAPTQTETPLSAQQSANDEVARIGTLAAYPLRARGQFLGVLAVAAGARLSARHLAALEELADLAALAADRDRLLTYSRSQEALAQTVVRHTPVAMAVLTGREHTFALTNPTFARLLGLDSETPLTGKRLCDVAPERAGLAVSLRLDAVYEAGEPQAMIELPIHLERDMTYWNVMSSPLPGVSTSVGGVLVAAVDVTRQVTARQRSQEVAEVAQERIGQMMTLHATSLAVASQLGADPRELLADILRRSISLLDARAGTVYVRDPRHDDLEVVVCEGLRGDYAGSRIRVGEGLAGRVAQTGQGLLIDDYRAYPFRAAIYDDEAFSAVIAVPLIHRGQVVGVLDVLDDAERRAFTDDDLWLLDLFAAQAAQAIENARTYVELEHAYRKQRDLDRMKDDFIAMASHELRTPLTGVQGFLDLLLDYPGSRDDPLALDFLQKASESALELGEIAERLLQTSRLDTGRIEPHLGPVRLGTVVEEALRSFRELQAAQGQTHELIAEVPPDLYVRADLGRLKETLDNLVSNAIKYSPKGGRVVVRGGPATFAAVERAPKSSGLGKDGKDIEDRPTLVLPHLPADAVDPDTDAEAPLPALVAAAEQTAFGMITVSDEGMGIPQGERSRLFGRFARMESARVSQIRGTGLGLYICRQTLRAMGGDVWLAASEPGHGSTFALALPMEVTP